MDYLVMKLANIFFPFYHPRHHFLSKKIWFRGITTLYILTFIIVTSVVWYQSLMGNYYDCVAEVEEYYGGQPSPAVSMEQFKGYFDARDSCNQGARVAWENWETPTIMVLIFFGFVHYLIQLIFFKVVINYVVLGSKSQ